MKSPANVVWSGDQVSVLDVLADRVITELNQCPFCDRDFTDTTEVILEIYQGQFQHLVVRALHPACWNREYALIQYLGGQHED